MVPLQLVKFSSQFTPPLRLTSHGKQVCRSRYTRPSSYVAQSGFSSASHTSLTSYFAHHYDLEKCISIVSKHVTHICCLPSPDDRQEFAASADSSQNFNIRDFLHPADTQHSPVYPHFECFYTSLNV